MVVQSGKGTGVQGDSLESLMVFLPFLKIVIDYDTCPFIS